MKISIRVARMNDVPVLKELIPVSARELSKCYYTEQQAESAIQVDAGRIRAFFIHPHWARKGIGRQIIQACEDAAKADGFTRMELIATMPGEPLYAAMGYEVTRRFDQPAADGTTIPLAHMKKLLL